MIPLPPPYIWALIRLENNLLLNISKSKEHKAGEKLRGTICGAPVERADNFRYLGVHITQDLSWSCHINTLVKKARQHLFFLRWLRDFHLPLKVLKNSTHAPSRASWREISAPGMGTARSRTDEPDLESIYTRGAAPKPGKSWKTSPIPTMDYSARIRPTQRERGGASLLANRL